MKKIFLGLMGILIFSGLAVCAEQPELKMIISVDWEGDSLAANNLDAIQQFRSANPEIKMVHFLNAAYFTKPGKSIPAVAAAIKSVLRPGDQLGLHLHGWESLFLAVGVPYRAKPSFWFGDVEAGPWQATADDRGHDIMVSAYTTEELRKVLRYSLAVLGSQGFKNIHAFRAGGWVAAPNVMEALAAEGFTQESSAVTVPLLEHEIAKKPLFQYLTNLWPGVTIQSIPYQIETISGSLMEYPDNFALADYVNGRDVSGLYSKLAAQAQGQNLYIHYGFHQETAEMYLWRVQTALNGIKAQASKDGYTFTSVVFDDIND